MIEQKTKTKQIIIVVAIIILSVAGIRVYSFLNGVEKTKEPELISEMESTDIQSSDTQSADTRSSIFVAQNSDGTDDGFASLINLMADNGLGFYQTQEVNGLIDSEDIIILKVNSQWNQRGGTNVDLVGSVIDAIINHPDKFKGEIIIADNGQDQYGPNNSGGSLDWEQSNGKDKSKSMLDLAESYKGMGYNVSTYSWDTITKIEVDEFENGDMDEGFVVDGEPNEDTKITVSYPKFISEAGTYISFKKGVWDKSGQSYDSDKLKIINMPVLKTHLQYGVTGAVKCYMGVPSEKLTHNAHSTVGIGSMGTLMAQTRIPVLNIMDAIYINANTTRPKYGPSTTYDAATFTKTILVSTDPIALDYYAAGEVLYPAIEALGAEVTSKFDRDSTNVYSFGYWLGLSMEQLQKAGYDCVMDTEKIDVYIVN